MAKSMRTADWLVDTNQSALRIDFTGGQFECAPTRVWYSVGEHVTIDLIGMHTPSYLRVDSKRY